MPWFVYILKSTVDGDFYKGITENIGKRFQEHNSGQSKFTSTKMPWTLVFLAEMHDKKNAIIEERRIKKLNRKSLEKLINSEENQISTILVD
jgi:putative endonuclease